MNSLDAFVALVDRIASSDKQYVALRGRAAAAGTSEERRGTYESMADILQGSAIGRMVQDRQALMALVGLMNNRDYVRDVENRVRNGAGAGERNFATIEGTSAFKAEQLAQEKAIGMQTALDRVNPLLGATADRLTALARQYPVMTAAPVAATTALTALAAAAGAAGVARLVMGSGAGTAAAGAGIGAAAVAGLAKAKAGLAWLLAAPTMGSVAAMGGGAMATAGAGVGAAGLIGYGTGTLLNEYLVNPLVEQFIGMRSDLQQSAAKPQQVEVAVKVHNGQIIAELQRMQATEAKRH